MANESYFRKAAVTWDPASNQIKSSRASSPPRRGWSHRHPRMRGIDLLLLRQNLARGSVQLSSNAMVML